MQNEFRNGIDRVLECISSRRTPTMGERRHGNRRARRKLRTRRNLSRRNKGHLHVRMHNSETQNYPDLCEKKFNGPWPLIMSLLKTNANFSISLSIIPLSCPSFAEFPCARNFFKATQRTGKRQGRWAREGDATARISWQGAREVRGCKISAGSADFPGWVLPSGLEICEIAVVGVGPTG